MDWFNRFVFIFNQKTRTTKNKYWLRKWVGMDAMNRCLEKMGIKLHDGSLQKVSLESSFLKMMSENVFNEWPFIFEMTVYFGSL